MRPHWAQGPMPSKGLGGVHPGLGPPAHRRLGKAAPLPTWLGDQKEVMVRLSSPSNRPAGRVGPRQASSEGRRSRKHADMQCFFFF